MSEPVVLRQGDRVLVAMEGEQTPEMMKFVVDGFAVRFPGVEFTFLHNVVNVVVYPADDCKVEVES